MSKSFKIQEEVKIRKQVTIQQINESTTSSISKATKSGYAYPIPTKYIGKPLT